VGENYWAAVEVVGNPPAEVAEAGTHLAALEEEAGSRPAGAVGNFLAEVVDLSCPAFFEMYWCSSEMYWCSSQKTPARA